MIQTPLSEGNISLILDTYGDIFSSFDPREYEQRALSDDFLEECDAIVHDKKFPIVEIRLLMPHAKREPESEDIIEKRLHAHFLEQAHQAQKHRKSEMLYGVMFIFVGLIIGLGVSAVIHRQMLPTFASTLLTVLGEPASWFGIWTGSDMLLRLFRTTHTQYLMSQKLHHAKIHFYGY